MQEEIIDQQGSNACSKLGSSSVLEKRARPQEQLNCPRCNSTNTKFCYYNNYSLTQPRYLCKTCRRYWTEGGTLRNVPVGGGSRKNRKSVQPLSSSSSSPSKIIIPDHHLSLSQQFPIFDQNPPPHHRQSQDLNLSFNEYYGAAQQHMEVPKTENDMSTASCNIQTPMPDSNAIYQSGFYLQQVNNIGGGLGRILFPFGDNFKQLSNAAAHEADRQNKGQGNSSGYWNGLLGGGSSW